MKKESLLISLGMLSLLVGTYSGTVAGIALEKLQRVEAGQAAFRESLVHTIHFADPLPDGPPLNLLSHSQSAEQFDFSEQPQEGVLTIYPDRLHPYHVREACARSLLGVYMNQFEEDSRRIWIRRAKRDCPRSVAR